jgi:hypothetical protein
VSAAVLEGRTASALDDEFDEVWDEYEAKGTVQSAQPAAKGSGLFRAKSLAELGKPTELDEPVGPYTSPPKPDESRAAAARDANINIAAKARAVARIASCCVLRAETCGLHVESGT